MQPLSPLFFPKKIVRKCVSTCWLSYAPMLLCWLVWYCILSTKPYSQTRPGCFLCPVCQVPTGCIISPAPFFLYNSPTCWLSHALMASWLIWEACGGGPDLPHRFSCPSWPSTFPPHLPAKKSLSFFKLPSASNLTSFDFRTFFRVIPSGYQSIVTWRSHFLLTYISTFHPLCLVFIKVSCSSASSRTRHGFFTHMEAFTWRRCRIWFHFLPQHFTLLFWSKFSKQLNISTSFDWWC